MLILCFILVYVMSAIISLQKILQIDTDGVFKQRHGQKSVRVVDTLREQKLPLTLYIYKN